MKFFTSVLLVLFVIAAGRSARADDSELSQWDLTLKTGAVTGTLSAIPLQTSSGAAIQAAQNYTFGGFPFDLGLNRDLNESLSIYLGIGLVADLENFQISRTGVDFELAYHLFGGSRRVIRENAAAVVISREPNNFSLLLNIGFDNYNALDKTSGASLTGAAFVFEAGIQYRFDMSDDTAVGIEILDTLLPLPASAENITPSNITFLINYRFYL